MNNVKLAIIYYSVSGTNYQMAKWAEERALEMGAEVRLRKTEELTPIEVIETNPAWKAHVEETKDVEVATSDDLAWADAIVFAVPTRFGGPAASMKHFLDQQGGIWAQGGLVDKVVSVSTSAGNAHGGQEATILSMYVSMMHWGAIIVPTGYTDDSIYKAGGNPYGTSVTKGSDGMVEDVKDAMMHQTQRTIEVASKLKG